MKPRIYKDVDGIGIMFAAQYDSGEGAIMRHSPVTGKNESVAKRFNFRKVKYDTWEDAQTELDRLADEYELEEMPLEIGGEI